jgi:hypothetical protein
LGGQGPDTSAPESIRYVNVAQLDGPDGSSVRLDLELTATSSYVPHDSSLNVLSGTKL